MREAEFYLEMTGWNIQEALSSYTEVNREGNMLLAMSFVKVRTYYILDLVHHSKYELISDHDS